jgi:hypothetical protein
VEVAQGHFREMKKGEIATTMITTCTMVYVRSNAGRVVIYHWPFTIADDGRYRQKMMSALESINATGNVALIKLFSKVNTAELTEYLRRYSRNIETVKLTYQEPVITFEGEQLGM